MANKRMFSKDIVAGSRFILLPHTAQNLYFHLGMHADDEGYCEYVSVMRLIAADNNDLRILQENGFICVYDLYTLCIQDWYIHNRIAPSRHTGSQYVETFPDRDLPLDKQYNPALTPCIQNVDNSYEQVRKGKVRLGKVSPPTPQRGNGTLPEWLNIDIWNDWVQHRKEIKHPLKPTTIKAQLKKLEKHKAIHVEILRYSIENGYQGLFPEKITGQQKKPTNKLQAEESKYAKYD